jgi:hypothetical protein
MKPLEISAVTNFALASETFLVAGILIGRAPLTASAAGFWAIALVFFAAGFYAGGVDHGFFEPKGDTRGRMVMQKITWICAGIATFFMLLTLLHQFASGSLRLAFMVVGLVQLAVFSFLSIRIHNFLIVIINYTPVLIGLLVLNVLGICTGSGSWYMIVGILVSIAASALEALSVNPFAPADRDGFFHVLLMVAVAFLFVAGFSLKS